MLKGQFKLKYLKSVDFRTMVTWPRGPPDALDPLPGRPSLMRRDAHGRDLSLQTGDCKRAQGQRQGGLRRLASPTIEGTTRPQRKHHVEKQAVLARAAPCCTWPTPCSGHPRKCLAGGTSPDTPTTACIENHHSIVWGCSLSRRSATWQRRCWQLRHATSPKGSRKSISHSNKYFFFRQPCAC